MSEREENQEVNIDDFIPATKYMAENNLSKDQLKIQILAGRIHPYLFLDMPKGFLQSLLLSVKDSDADIYGVIDIYTKPMFIQDAVGFFEIPVKNMLQLFRNEQLDCKGFSPVVLIQSTTYPWIIESGFITEAKFSIADIFCFLGYSFHHKTYFESRVEDLLKTCQRVSLAIPEFSYLSIENPVKSRKRGIIGYHTPEMESFDIYKNPPGNMYMSPTPKVETSSTKEEMEELMRVLEKKEREELTAIYDGLINGNRYVSSALTKEKVKQVIPLEDITFENLYLSFDKKPALRIQDLSNSKSSNSANLEIAEKQKSECFDNEELTHYVQNESEDFRALCLAQEKFWCNYDPADPTTAPLKSTVVAFLEDNGLSKGTAEKADTILRGGRNRPN